VPQGNKAILIANTGFALHNFRLPLIKKLSDRGWEIVVAASDEADYASSFRELGYRFINVKIDHKGKNPVKDLFLILRLRGVYRQEAPDLVHHFTIKPVIFGTLAARMAKVPAIVNTITGLGYVFLRGGLLSRLITNLYRIALHGGPRVIFQNIDDCEFFISKGILKRKQGFMVPGSGVDTHKIVPVKRRRRDGCVTFVMVSRMLWSKGVREYVTAVGIVKRSYPQSEFLLVGGHSGGGAIGNPESVPIEWLQQTNNGKVVKWVGRVRNEEVLRILDSSSVCVLPSFYPEGVPKSLLEAAAKGKPIITTDAPGCREVVTDGVNGFLVPKKDSEGLAKAMMQFFEQPEIIPKMGKESRRRAVDLFDQETVVQKVLDIYQQTL